MSKRAAQQLPTSAAQDSQLAGEQNGLKGEPKVRDHLPATLPILSDEAAILDSLLGTELARLFEEE
ncbi:hypothetical protein [Altericroceibacterium endophyticum]|uniref:Uncharacterized protein n=1 Tax=Altericroceibacterium endophyticum TaxID=1808508 RepID=A0A6I4T3W8_9SPHN|nr:hypothetical protein [Altericroceibacterium endophyticum]MXO65964.1 hypothetical protein [Altericroceibacterium endophyticum]